MRAKILGMPLHPRIGVDHPLANKTEAQVHAMAEVALAAVVQALTVDPQGGA